MTYWLTIAFIVSLAIFVSRIDADLERLNVGADTNTNSYTASDTTKDSQATNDRLSKRASFMPSRGKKEQSEDDSVDKRAAAAFMPMRGRKDYYQPQAQGWYVGAPQYDYQNGMDDKRAGFMPMRGRKNSAYDPEMRASASNFYSDVYPMELNDMKRRSSFMPMRGRKDDIAYDQLYGQPSYAVPQPYSQSIQNIDNTNWMEGQHSITSGRGGLAASETGPDLEKKSSFFGARGKRSAQTDSEIASNSVHKRSIGGQLAFDHHKYNENFFASRG